MYISVYVNVDEDVDEPNTSSSISELGNNMENDQNALNLKKKFINQNRQSQDFQQKTKSK